jgi:predicted negative regulator of RcsB-dependent stress response
MAYDLQEQDQLDAFKAFWNKWGNVILTVLTVILLAVAAWRGWGYWQQKQAAQASGVYDQLTAAVQARDIAKVKQASGELFERYSGTVYGSMASLVAAKAYVDAGDLKAARAPLQWAVDKAADPEYRMLARLRLAGVLLDEKAYDEGLQVLTVAEPGVFAGAFADRRGDLLMAQGKTDPAREAYREALKKLEASSALRPIVQLKLDALGGA